MQTIIAVIVFGLILISVIVMIVIYLAYKGVRKIKQEAEDNYYRSQKRKEQKRRIPLVTTISKVHLPRSSEQSHNTNHVRSRFRKGYARNSQRRHCPQYNNYEQWRNYHRRSRFRRKAENLRAL